MFLKALIIQVREVNIVKLHAADFFKLLFDTSASFEGIGKNLRNIITLKFAVRIKQLQQSRNGFTDTDNVALIEVDAFWDCKELTLAAKPGSYAEPFVTIHNAKQRIALEVVEPGPLYGIVANDKKDERLHLRSEPGANAPSVGQFQNGTAARILSENNGWLHVAIGEAQGYVQSKSVFQVTDDMRIIEPRYGLMKNSASALRYPLEGSGVVFSINAQSFVEITETAGCFYKILYTGMGMEGYVPTTDVWLYAPSGVEATIGVVANPDYRDRLNLREEPSTSAASLGRFYNGVQVEIYWVENDEWCYVRVGKYESEDLLVGYMMRKFIDLVR